MWELGFLPSATQTFQLTVQCRAARCERSRREFRVLIKGTLTRHRVVDHLILSFVVKEAKLCHRKATANVFDCHTTQTEMTEFTYLSENSLFHEGALSGSQTIAVIRFLSLLSTFIFCVSFLRWCWCGGMSPSRNWPPVIQTEGSLFGSSMRAAGLWSWSMTVELR